MRILILKGASQYGGTRLFCDHAAESFRRRGDDVTVLDAAAAPILKYVGTSRFDLIFSINIHGEFRDAAGRTLTDLYEAPHVVWHTDYILSQAQRLRGTPRSTALLLVDPTQVEAVKSLYGPDRFDHVSFFPHPAVGRPVPDEASVAAFIARRPIEILWSGGFQAPVRPWSNTEGAGRQVLDDAFDLATGVEWMPPHEALDEVLTARGLDLGDPDFLGLREGASLIDAEVRRTRRFEFLRAVAETGLPVHVCGEGWDSQRHRFKNAEFEGPVEMTRMVELMSRSRVVLNTNGNFGAGSHERPFSASLAGAATFSDWSRYYRQVFEPGGNIELFFWKKLDLGMAALSELVADPERCLEYGRAAKAQAVAHHTWDQRIELILAAADAVRQG